MSKGPSPLPQIVNRKAGFNYEILEKLEAGLALTGSEVKSLRSGRVSLEEAFVTIREGEAWLRQCNISHYPQAGYAQHVTTRERKLLLHRRELRKLLVKVMQRGFTIIPLRIFFNDRGLAKVQIALVRGKKLHDKRETLKQRDDERRMKRAERGRR